MGIDNEGPVEVQVEALLSTIKANAERVKELGNWPAYMDAESILERVPKSGDNNAPGFDAGLACTLDLISRDKQKLAATLHGAYTPEAVQQIREEIKNLDPDSETCLWLSACSVCTEGNIDQKGFLKQVEDFKNLMNNPALRLEKAKQEFDKMVSNFHFEEDFGSDVPYGEIDGCMQGAYIAGHSFAVQYNPSYGIYFIGTYEDSLGLEDFQWSEKKDEQGRAVSGPVWGSRQFVKCADRVELKKALNVVKNKFVN